MVKKPALKYYGGKWQLAKWTISLMPSHRGYCEPFGGAASVLLQKHRSHTEIYNDLDEEVVNLFRVLRDSPKPLIEKIQLTPVSRDEFRKSYEFSQDCVERARRMLVRSFFSFGGVGTHFRSSSFIPGTHIESGTSPGTQWRDMPESLQAIVDRLRGVVIENRPAEEIIERYDNEQMLFYVDPPYVTLTRTVSSVYKHEMSDKQQVSLIGCLLKAKGKVMLAGYTSDLYSRMLKEWKRFDRVSLDGRHNKRVECIWVNFENGEQMLTL